MPQENSVRVGLVVDIDDPERLGRVRVTFPTLGDQRSHWARLVTPMGGKERGIHFRPEVGDEMLVAFEEGDICRPYVIGAMWSRPDRPPPDDGANQNNWRFIVSRSGHQLIFNDKEGAETIEIIDYAKKRRVVIDAAGQKIRVQADSGDVEVEAPQGTVKVQAQTVQVEGTTVEIKSTGSMKLDAGSQLEIKAAMMEIAASGPLKLKGALIDIN